MIGRPVANARMYGVAPGAVAAWRALFARVSKRSGVALDVIDHAAPAALSDLWQRPDLGAAFMCGWPFVRDVADVIPIAAPVMLNVLAAGRPIYWTEMVVRADDPARSLDDLRCRTVAFTIEHSQSGFNAIRHFLRQRGGGKLFGREFGPVFTPRRVVEAVIAGNADVGPVDSLAYELLALHATELMAGVRTIAQTDPTPSPLLVASAGLGDARVSALRDAFVGLADDPTSQFLLHALTLRGFAIPLPRDEYMTMEISARASEAAGIHRLEPTL